MTGIKIFLPKEWKSRTIGNVSFPCFSLGRRRLARLLKCYLCYTSGIHPPSADAVFVKSLLRLCLPRRLLWERTRISGLKKGIADMDTAQNIFDSNHLSLRKFWFDATHDSQWLYRDWFKLAHDSKWISEIWFKSTHDSKIFKNIFIQINSGLKKTFQDFDSNQLMTQKNLE